MFACSSWLLGYAAAISIDQPLHYYFGKSFCAVVDFICGLGGVQYWLGGVGIAWMRAIYIRFSTRVSMRENTAAVLIGFVTLATIFGLRFFHYMVYTPTYPDFEPICLGRPIDDPLLDFNAPRSLDVNAKRLAGVFLGLVVIPLMLSEIAMYVSIFKFLIKHDKMMRLALSDTTIKKRIKKNGIDLFGHAIIFFTESSSLLIKSIELCLAIDISPTELRNRRWMFKCINISMYGIASILHIVMSSSLRSDTFAIVRKLSLPLIRFWTSFQDFKYKRNYVAPKMIH